MSRDKGLIYIAMRGGLGNQLFQWQAGKLLQFFTSLDIAFIPQQRKLAHNDVGIRAFDLAKVSVFRSRSRTCDVWLKKLLRQPEIGLNIKNSIVKRATLFQEVENSDFIEFCKIQRKSDIPFLLDGYFQSARISLCLRENNLFLEFPSLKFESTNYRDFINLISSAEFTAIHIRRGDYSKYSSTIGVLSERYYLQAAEKLGLQGSSQIIIFTDDSPDAIAKEFAVFFQRYKNIVFAPKLHTSAEILLAMSKCSGIIAANSTLSWWAGYASTNASVITPYPFFKNLPNRFDLQLPNSKNEIAQWL